MVTIRWGSFPDFLGDMYCQPRGLLDIVPLCKPEDTFCGPCCQKSKYYERSMSLILGSSDPNKVIMKIVSSIIYGWTK